MNRTSHANKQAGHYLLENSCQSHKLDLVFQRKTHTYHYSKNAQCTRLLCLFCFTVKSIKDQCSVWFFWIHPSHHQCSPTSSPCLHLRTATRFHNNCVGRDIFTTITTSDRTTLIFCIWKISSSVTSATCTNVRCSSRITLATVAIGCSWTTTATRARTGFSCRTVMVVLLGCGCRGSARWIIMFWATSPRSYWSSRGWIEDIGFLFIQRRSTARIYLTDSLGLVWISRRSLALALEIHKETNPNNGNHSQAC